MLCIVILIMFISIMVFECELFQVYPQNVSITNQTRNFLAIATGEDEAIAKLIAQEDYITAASDLYAIASLMQLPLEVTLKPF